MVHYLSPTITVVPERILFVCQLAAVLRVITRFVLSIRLLYATEPHFEHSILQSPCAFLYARPRFPH